MPEKLIGPEKAPFSGRVYAAFSTCDRATGVLRSKRRVNAAAKRGISLAIAMCLASTAVVRADDLSDSASRQQDIREQTQSVSQQIDAIVGEFDANGLGGGEDVKTLRAVKGVLGKLSDDQMQQVVHLLLQARDEKSSTAATSKVADAYTGQKQIITQLRALLVQYQHDQAMDTLSTKLNQLADRQNENLKGAVLLAKQSLANNNQPVNNQPINNQDALKTQQAEQTQIKDEVAQATADLKALAAQGGDDRLTAAAAKADDNKLADTTAAAADDLANGNLLRAAAGEKSARDQLRDLAKLVAPPVDKSTQLAAAAEKLDDQIQKQKQINVDAAERDRKTAAATERRQADLSDQTDATRQDLAEVAPVAADKLKSAHDAMQDVRQSLNSNQMDKASKNGEVALKDLQQARAEIGRQMDENSTEANETPKDLATRAAELQQQQQDLADQTVNKNGQRDGNVPHEQLAAEQAKLTARARDLQADTADRVPDAAAALDNAAKHMADAQDQLTQNHKKVAADEERQAATDLAKAQDAINQAAKAAQQAQEDLAKTEAARDRVADAMVKQADAYGQTAAGQKPQDVANGAQQQAADAAKQADQALQNAPPDAGQTANQPLAAAQQDMQQAKAGLQKGDAASAQPQQQQALADLQKAKSALDQKIEQTQQQLGEQPTADGAQAAADHVAEELKAAQAEVAKAQQALAQGNKGDADAAQHLQQAEADAAKAAARDQGMLGQAGQQAMQQAQQALQQGQQQAKSGQNQQANQSGDQASTAMANAMMAMQMASAQAKANADAAKGQPKQYALAQGKSQDKPGETPGQDPGQTPGDDEEQQKPEKGPGKSKDPKYAEAGTGNADGQRADVRGSGQFLGLPPRDRQAVQQSQGEKYPQEYGTMVEQYYRNLSDDGKAK